MKFLVDRNRKAANKRLQLTALRAAAERATGVILASKMPKKATNAVFGLAWDQASLSAPEIGG